VKAFALIFAALGFLLGSSGFSQDAQGDKDKIQGTWKIVSFEARGPKDLLSKEALKSAKVVIKGDKITFHFGKKTDEARFKLDPAKKPKTINFVGKKTADTSLGIYLLEGDDLKLCWNVNDTERPTEFSKVGKVGQELRLAVLKREKKK